VKASIGVPAYNQGQYLAETLDSLLRQAVPPDEIVVSDNHSTDETPEILRRYEGRIRVIRPAEHMAVADHWNFVAGNLHSEWFSMLSSDDIAEPWYLENLLRHAARDSSAAMVRGGVERDRTRRSSTWNPPAMVDRDGDQAATELPGAVARLEVDDRLVHVP
jgi:glycosyltransferase involved in cell wall biosynthesis